MLHFFGLKYLNINQLQGSKTIFLCKNNEKHTEIRKKMLKNAIFLCQK